MSPDSPLNPKTYHIGRDKTGQVEHGITIQAQVILDHPVSNLLGHLTLWHLIFGEIFCGESAAVYGGSEGILALWGGNLELLKTLHERSCDMLVGWDFSEVHHVYDEGIFCLRKW